jgi:thiamine phosphate synthase YjbQ (UPF0047 family)
LKSNISRDAHLLNELLETDKAIVVSAGKMSRGFAQFANE